MFLHSPLDLDIYPDYFLLNIEDVLLQFFILNKQTFNLFFSLC